MNKIILKIAFIPLIYFIIVDSNAQNLFFIGENSYPSSEKFNIISSTDGSANNEKRVSGFFAKNGENGFLILSPENDSQMMIKGGIIIYLEDGSMIKCVDRGMYDRVNKKSTTIFKLENSELKELMKSEIHSIRYSLKCIDCTFSGEDGDYIGRNSTKSKLDNLIFFSTPDPKDSKPLTYDTKALVYNLFY